MMFKRSDRTAAHREDVGERVGRGDLAVGERVVHDRGEEVDRLHERAIAIERKTPASSAVAEPTRTLRFRYCGS